MSPGAENDQIVQSVDRALQILELLGGVRSAGVSEISRELGVHRSTAFRLLATLEARDLVEQESQRGTYRLGLGILRLAGDVTARMDIVTEAQAVCEAVAAGLNETSNVAILDEGAAVNIAQATGTNAVAIVRQYVGRRTPLHATSTGKVLLAYAPERVRDEVLEAAAGAGLEACTPHTITDADELAAHLAQVRERGWASAVEEWEPDTNALAVPVRDASGDVVAALSVTAPGFRMGPDGFPPLAGLLRDFAGQLSTRLGAPHSAV